MTVATALAVSWKPLTNSKPSAISIATPSSRNGRMVVGPPPLSREVRVDRIGHIEQAASEHRQENEREPDVERVVEMRLHRRRGRGSEASVECGGHGIAPSAARPLWRKRQPLYIARPHDRIVNPFSARRRNERRLAPTLRVLAPASSNHDDEQATSAPKSDQRKTCGLDGRGAPQPASASSGRCWRPGSPSLSISRVG